MGDLTKNLSKHEFSCQCRLKDCPAKLVADFELVNVLQEACDHFKALYKAESVIIDITGGNRCRPHNASINGSATNSHHIDCIAADHKIFYKLTSTGNKIQVDPKVVYDYYDKKYFDKYGVGLYSNRVHIDVRKTKARWGK